MNETDYQLKQLFNACDIDGSGYVGIEEVRELCSKFGASDADANEIFYKLDRDGDGKVSFEDFRAGFDDYEKGVLVSASPLSPVKKDSTFHFTVTPHMGTTKSDQGTSRRDDVSSTDDGSTSSEKRGPLLIPGISSKIIRSLSTGRLDEPNYKNLDGETLVQELIDKLNELQGENKLLSESIMRDRRKYDHHLEEMELEVKQIEDESKKKATAELEAERKHIRDSMKDEFDKLQENLDIIRKVDSWLKQNKMSKEDERINEYRFKLEEAVNENRQMRHSLLDTHTEMALMRSDIAQLRVQYEEKCRELEREKEKAIMYIQEQDHLSRQVHVLQDANRKLLDSNDVRDSMNSPIGTDSRRSPVVPQLKRGSIIGDYIHPAVSAMSRDSNKYVYREEEEEADDSGNSSDRHYHRPTSRSKSHLSHISGNSDLEDCIFEVHYPQQIPMNPSDYMPALIDVSGVPSIATPSTPSTTILVQSNADGPAERTFKVIFIGDAGVGKTSLVVRITRGHFSPNVSSTLGVDFQVRSLKVQGHNVALQLWDTAGQERFRSITRTYFRKVDGIMLLYDVANEHSFLNVRRWISDIESQTDSCLPLMVIGNKVDLRNTAPDHMVHQFISRSDGEKMAKEAGGTFVEISVKEGTNIDFALGSLILKMMETEDRMKATASLSLNDKSTSKKLFRCC